MPDSVLLTAMLCLATGPLATGPLATDAPEAMGDTAAVAALSAQRLRAESDHLTRLGIWGGASVVGGAALFALSQPAVAPPGILAPEIEGVAIQSMAWGSINLAITGVGLLTQQDPTSDRDEALAAEDLWAKVLLVNIGLDVGYMMAGGALVAASLFGVQDPVTWRSHGAGIISQGLGLFVLDVIALGGSAERERALADLPNPSR
jgi:hypothetical protein